MVALFNKYYAECFNFSIVNTDIPYVAIKLRKELR